MALSSRPTGNRPPAYFDGIPFIELRDIVAQLPITKIFAPEQGTVIKTEEWRIDRQKPEPGEVSVNLQIQKNGVGRPSTISCVLVPWIYYQPDARGGSTHAQYTARTRELERVVRDALIQSAQTHYQVKDKATIEVLEICGPYSN